MKRRTKWMGLLIAAASSAVGCGGDGTTQGEIAFHGEVNPLGTFAYDTGLQPPSSPVQVGLAFSSSAKLSADARAIATDGDVLVGKPGTGELALDASFSLVGRLKVDVTGVPGYDGDIPGLDAIDIHFGGEQAFDPFATGKPVELTVNLPETKLPDIPLPGGLPGSMQLTITPASTLTSSFSATCVADDGKKATYHGASTTHGSIVIHPVVVISIPIVGDKSFDLSELTVPVPVPDLAADIDLGTKPITETGDAPPTGEKSSRKSCDDDGIGGSGVGGSGAGGNGSAPATGSGQTSTGSSPPCSVSTECGPNEDCQQGECLTPPSSVTITVPSGRGVATTVWSFECAVEDAPGECLWFRFDAPGLDPDGSSIIMAAQSLGAHCEAPQNVSYDELIDNTVTAQCDSDGTSPCGFVVEELPVNGTGRFRGHYSGTLLGFGPYEGSDREVSFSFDVAPNDGSL